MIMAEEDKEELKWLATEAWDQFKLLREREDAIKMLDFRVGDTVLFAGGGRRTSALFPGAKGTVKKVMRKRVLVDFGNFKQWKVPVGLLRKEKK